MSTHDDLTRPDDHKEQAETNSDFDSSAKTEDSDAHVSGTGLGALGGTTLATAVGGAVGGPVGAAVGAAVGSIAGGLAGNRVAEVLESTEDDNANKEVNDNEEDTADQNDQ